MKRFLAALLGCAAFLPVGQGADGPRRLDEIVPADTLFYASIPDVARAREVLKTTALADIWREPEVRAFARDQLAPLLRELFWGIARQKAVERGAPDEGFDAFIAGLDEPDPRIGMRPLDLPGILDGDLSVAVLDVSPREKTLTAVAVLGPCRLPDALRASLEEASARTVETGGISYARNGWIGAAGPGPQGRGETGWACAPDRRLVATVGPPGTLARVVEDLGKKSEAPLSGAPDYRALAARRPGKGEAVVHAYLSVSRIKEKILAAIPDEAARAAAPGVIEGLGFSPVRAAGMSIAVKDKGFLRSTVLLAPGEKKGLLAALAGDPEGTFESLAFVPAGTHSYYAVRIDPAKVWRSAREAVETATGTVGLQAARDALDEGLPLLRSLVGALGSEVGLAVKQQIGMMPIPEVTLFARVRDEPASRKLVEDLLAEGAAAGKLKAQTSPGIGGGPAVTMVMMPNVPIMPAFAFHKGWFVAALTPTAVKAACRRIDAPDPGKGIGETKDFKTAFARVAKPGSLLAYDEGPDSFRKQYNQLVGTLPMVLMGLEQSGLELPPVDLAALPMADTVARHLFGSAQVAGADADGVYVESFGVMPFSVTDVAGIGVAAGLALPAIQKARSKAEARRAAEETGE